ncbi:sugar ABC transporter substrate-binding protein [Methylobacterium sp. BTF04]|uniref:polysaccharide biosynthesis/export family protein n=1 Tax=Methylobacterium sp. BTF04 TaxID=2708300 RepID=UPI0013D402F5|nr:polysaccharide biosynthesis/export family protein [Methylobacterium sp. BTF04]NEU14265.1 sugar ABC transporter substrate-binding protein [Methylobacterium sp. BTF04]
MLHLVARALLAGSLFTLPLGTAAAGPDRYRLGPEDRIRLRVNEWRAAKGESYEWTAMSGEFSVDAGGRLFLPLIGEIEAGGRTTEEIALAIGERMQRKVGLTQRPDASVEVSQFRPIYVVGQVDKPGAYPYRPQLTVLQAVGLAGGFYRPPELGAMRLAREAISSRGDLQDIGIERSALMVRRVRLELEMRDGTTLTFPDAILSQRAVPNVADAIREETALFEARRTALLSQIEALNQAKQLIATEIATLQAKIVSQDRQLTLARKELDSIAELVQRGLSISPRQLALEQTVAQMESTKLDTVLAISRARQDISRNDRTILDLKNQRQSTVLADLRETQTKLAKLDERAQMTRNLLTDSETIAPKMLDDARSERGRRRPVFVVVRQSPDGPREIATRETDPMEPGDVLKVDGEFVDGAPPISKASDATVRPGSVASVP